MPQLQSKRFSSLSEFETWLEEQSANYVNIQVIPHGVILLVIFEAATAPVVVEGGPIEPPPGGPGHNPHLAEGEEAVGGPIEPPPHPPGNNSGLEEVTDTPVVEEPPPAA